MAMRQAETAALRAQAIRKTSLDKDLGKIGRLEDATRLLSRRQFAPGAALLFLALAGLIASFHMGSEPNAVIIIAAAVIGGYMALNIGANDVANNVGPAVGARALTMTGALFMAAIFESAGALIAGGNVVETISKGIVDPALVPSANTFIWIMMSALLSSAIWVNIATYLGAPVSTTHAIVGGVMGAGIAAVGTGAVDWVVVWAITASWIVSPLIGGHHRRGLPGLHKGQRHLPGRQDRGGTSVGAVADCVDGGLIYRLSRAQGLEPRLEARAR